MGETLRDAYRYAGALFSGGAFLAIVGQADSYNLAAPRTGTERVHVFDPQSGEYFGSFVADKIAVSEDTSLIATVRAGRVEIWRFSGSRETRQR